MWKHHFPVVVCLLATLVLPANMYGQIDQPQQYQAWLRYNPKITLSDNWTLKSDIDERIFIFPARQFQWIVRTQAEYNIREGWAISAGASVFCSSLPQDPDLPVSEIRYELRPELETNFKKQILSDLHWTNRVRLDFRFPNNGESYAYSATRFRYMTGFSWAFSEDWKWAVWDEILLHVASTNGISFFDQNRIGTNVTYAPSGPFSYDMAYFYWYQERPAPNDPYRRHIIRFTLQHRIGKKAS